MLHKNINEEESGLTINIKTNWRRMLSRTHTNSGPGAVGKLVQQLGYQLTEETLADAKLSYSPSPVHLHQVLD